MSDEPNRTDRVSFEKKTGGASTRPSGLGAGRRGGPNLAADGTPMPPPPTTVPLRHLTLFLSGLFSLLAAVAVFANKPWVKRSLTKSNDKLKGKKGYLKPADLQHTIDRYPITQLLMAAVLLLALSFVARGVWRGRSWSRWTVIAVWVLASFLTGTFAGLTSILNIGADVPVAIKVPAFVSAALLIGAVVLVSLAPSAKYFALTKPPRPTGAGAGAQGGGLFGPRPQRPAAAPATAPRRDAATRPAGERGKAKQRAASDSAASVAKGAELARARAKASKSRRTGV